MYRLDRIQELYDFGFEELLEGHVTIVEWGEAIALVLPRDRIDVRLAMDDAADDGARVVEVVRRRVRAWAVRQGALDAALEGLGARRLESSV